VNRDKFRNQLKPAIRKKRHSWLSSGGCLQQDNARHTVQQMQVSKVVVLHLPSYAPDWAPSDFPLFCPIKDSLGGRHFRSYEAVHDWLAQQPKGIPRNLCLNGTLAEVCRKWWGTALKIDVIALRLFVQYSTFYIFSGLHLNGSCTSRLHTCRSTQGINCNLLAFQS